MKKFIAAVCISVMVLCGCGSQTAYLKPYTVVTAGKTSDVVSMLNTDVWEGFAENLGVVSVEDSQTGVNAQTLSEINGTEILLTGTTDHTVLTAYNIYTQMPPASITKILTALVALKYGGDLDQKVILTDDVNVDVWDAQMCGFKPGDEMTLRTLLYSMLVYSGNDAANAVASAVSGGDIPAFCELMNEEARKLGATQTHFVTPNGLDDPDHYTTAYDLYLIFNECLKYDEFRDAISQSHYTAVFVRDGEECRQSYDSTNYYLLGNKTPPEGVTVIGGKTGTTDNAGLCLILYVEDEAGDGYISVLLGCPDKDTLYASMSKLLSDIRK
ncbi:MAG: D-alanyl-D-alanine carboxypeptidase family protein [Coprococcus sp.]